MIPAPRTGRHDAAPYPAATLTAAIAGDPDAFAELWRAHYAEVRRYVIYRLPDRHAAEDITAEAFARAWRNIGAFAEARGGGFPGWLITIARNLIADLRKSSRYRREFAVGEMYDGDQLADDPETVVVNALAAQTIRAAIGDLNPHQRGCIEARFLDDLTVAETSDRLGIGQSAVKTLQYRAVRTLARDPRLTKELTET